MVNNKSQEKKHLDAVFAALSNSTRRGMFHQLCRGPASIGELGGAYGISKPAVTKHIKVLERAGLLRRHRDGRIHRCVLNPKPMEDVMDWITESREFWEQSLDALGQYLDSTTKTRSTRSKET